MGVESAGDALAYYRSLPDAAWHPHIETIQGNVEDPFKQLVINSFEYFVGDEPLYGSGVGKRLSIRSINVTKEKDGTSKVEIELAITIAEGTNLLYADAPLNIVAGQTCSM